MNDNSLISIITPSFNSERFIHETIESVKAQTYTNWELLITDDYSTDGTWSLLEKYAEKDNRIKIFKLKRNSGAAVARNNSISHAKGRFIAFCDSDDLWHPTKLKKQVEFMKSNNYYFSYHDYIEIDEESNELGIHVSGIKRVNKFLMYSCCWPGCLSVMYDAKHIGLIQINDIKKNNDTAMWLKIIQKADCYLLKDTLGEYRRRQGSITPQSIISKIKWHYILFHKGDKKNPIVSFWWMCMNVLGNTCKKTFYVKKYFGKK